MALSAQKSTTPRTPLVRGAAARPLTAVQGHQFTAIVANLDAHDHQQTGAILDAEGDVLRDRLADKLTVATAWAKREGAAETYRLLVACIAMVRRINELDSAEDYHLITEASAGVDQALISTRRACSVLEGLLTGRDEGDSRLNALGGQA